jgi:hypothetical protein
MKLTAEEKLQWLEEINELTRLCETDETREIRKLIREGKL